MNYAIHDIYIYQTYVWIVNRKFRLSLHESIHMIHSAFPCRALNGLHPWMSSCWNSSSLQRQGSTTCMNRHFSMLISDTIPLCSFFYSSWHSGLPRTCLMSWICPTAEMSWALRTWITYLHAAWFKFQIERVILCTARVAHLSMRLIWIGCVSRRYACSLFSFQHGQAAILWKECQGV